MKQKTQAMIGIMATAAAQGLCIAPLLMYARSMPLIVAVVFSVLLLLASYFPFAWILHDRRERGFPRSYRFNLGIAVFGFATVPFYLWRSRAPGQRLLAQLGMLGVVAGSSIVSIGAAIVGAIFVALLSPSAQA